MRQSIFTSHPSSLNLTTTRIAVAGLMFAHGLWKLGAWGGPGYAGLSRYFTETLHLPGVVPFLVVLGETAGAVLLATGAFTRVIAASVILTMLGAIVTVHWPNGFFMNWTGTAAGEGFELHLLVIAMASQLVMAGSGAAALDPHIGRFLDARRQPLAVA